MRTEPTEPRDPTERPRVFVHLLPCLIPHGALRGGVAVVVDVLRATTVMVHALAAGCTAVIPCGTIEEAQRVAAGFPPGTALLGGERGGLPIPGFDLGNSPGEFTRAVCDSKTLVMTTTNGTRAILASLESERVYIASFANLRATSAELAVQFLKKDHGHPVHIVCSGTEGHISLEDSLLAGALVKNVANVAHGSLGNSLFGNDQAYIVLSQWLQVEEYLEQRPLWPLLEVGRGGQNVLRIGRAADLRDAAEFDRFTLVAELSRDPLRIVAI
ncbi:MAG TPA: 2-phosphosulfolactate phosphatase [Isosphaeraceae bacterium]|nr:2-phosphosulfolactate phosphatase [Isosphaeraceae bacterium]